MMKSPANLILMIVTVLIGIVVILLFYLKSKNEKSDKQIASGLTFDRLVDIVKYSINDLISEEVASTGTDLEFATAVRIKARLQNALKDCVYGIDQQKEIVKDLIKSILVRNLKTEEEIRQIIDFKGRFIEPRIKFEILMYFYKQQHGVEALTAMIEEFGLARERFIVEDQTAPSYAITIEDIDIIYSQKNFHMDYTSMIDVLTVLVYQKYKGFGIVDTLREMDINGFNCGTSGSIMTNLRKAANKTQWTAPRSVWLYYQGTYIHLRFLSFGTEEELKRVVQLLVRFNKPGPLTEKRGYIVNTMFDKSRVLALRPPASEYWAVFVRKFTLVNATTEKLLIKSVRPNLIMNDDIKVEMLRDSRTTQEIIEQVAEGLGKEKITDEIINVIMKGIHIPGFVKNAHLAVNLLKYLMLGEVTCGITGRQGSGKTTLMGTLVRFMNPKYNIRVLEMAFELYLREAYPERNILSVQETEWVSASALQDALKKSDAAISMVGEVATDIIAARMLQFAQIASLFTIFSHHANRTEDLVTGIRNSICAAGNFSNMTVAEQQVIDVIHVDIHLDYTAEGKRYIDRVTEIIKLDEGIDYPDFDPKDPFNSFAKITREYYHRTTDRRSFKTVDILKYDLETDTYYPTKWFSERLTNHMLERMPDRVKEDFSQFVLDNWINREKVK